jgi:hypothetical protein
MTTASGVVGLRPGTAVRIVEDRGATMVVSDGAAGIELQANTLTNDMDYALSLAKRDAQIQQELASTLAQQQAAARASQERQEIEYSQRQRELLATDPVATWRPDNKLDRGAYDQHRAVSRAPAYIPSISTVIVAAPAAQPTPKPTATPRSNAFRP